MALGIEGGTEAVVGVLGPTTWTGANATILDLRRRERELLAALALHHPGPVARPVLIDLIWAGQPPPTATTALRNHTARLRAALGGGVTLVGPTGHRLAAGVTTDVVLFHEDRRRAEATARAEARVAAVQRALSWWRGQPFDDLQDGPEVDAARRALVEARWQAEEDLADALLAVGAPGAAVEALEAQVADQPYRERRWELLLVARHRMGDRRAALLAVDRARRALAEVGLDIGPGLRRLEDAALRDDPALGEPGPSVPLRGGGGIDPGVRTAPQGPAPFVGRADEERRLRAAVAGRRASGRPVVVYGEAGIGKTVLLDRLAGAARAAGTLVVAAIGDPRPPVPLAAWRGVLDQLRAAGAITATDLLATLPPASARVPAVGSPRTTAQDRIVGAVLDALTAAGGARALMLVFDDVQLAPPSTRRLLVEAVAADLPLTVVAGVRGTDRRDVCALLGSPPDIDAIALRGLDEAAVADYVAGHAPVVVPSPRWLHAQTGGNPLLLRHAVDALDDEGAGDGALLADVGTRLLDLRLRDLSASSVALLGLAAVFGQRCRVDELEEAAGPSGAVIAELTAAGLLILSDSGEELCFAHQLLQEATYRALTDGQRLELHEAAALAVAGRATGAAVHAVAHHRLALADLDPVEAVRCARASAEAHLSAFAFEDAAERLAAAEAVARRCGLAPALACGLAVARGEALRQAGDPTSVEVLANAADEAEALGEGELLAGCALGLCRLGPTSAAGATDQVATAVADRALAVTADLGLRAEVAGASSLLHSMDGDPDRCRALYEQAEALARRHADPGTLARVLPHAYLALNRPDDLLRVDALAGELASLAAARSDLPSAWEAELLRYAVTLQRAEDGVDGVVARMEELATSIGEPTRQWETEYVVAATAHLHGRFEEAERRIDATLRFTRSVAASRVEATWGALILAIRIGQGRAGELIDALAGLTAAQPLVPGWRAATAYIAATTGDRDRARQALDSFRTDGRIRLPTDFSWTTLGVLLAACAAELGDEDAVADLRTSLAPVAGRLSWAGFATYGPVDTALGRLAAAAGDRDRAARHWHTAVALAQRVGAPTFAAEAEDLLAHL